MTLTVASRRTPDTEVPPTVRASTAEMSNDSPNGTVRWLITAFVVLSLAFMPMLIGGNANAGTLPAGAPAADLSLSSTPVKVSAPAIPLKTEVASTWWWGSTTWYSRSEVRAQADDWGIISITKLACKYAPWYLGSACRATVGNYTDWVVNTWKNAKNRNQCLTMSMTWTGQVTDIRAYDCTWG